MLLENHKLTYFSSKGVMLNLTDYPYACSISDLRDWSWSYQTVNNKLCNFKRSKFERTLVIYFMNTNLAAREKLYDAIEYDTATGNTGSLIFWDFIEDENGKPGQITWELDCNVTASEKINNGDIDVGVKLTITSENPAWKKTNYYFVYGSGTHTAINHGRDYKRYYDWGYSTPYVPKTSVDIQSPAGGGYELIFEANTHKDIVNPGVWINGIFRGLEGYTLKADEELWIRSYGDDKFVRINGNNAFGYRKKDPSIFTPLVYGNNKLSYDAIDFLLEIREEWSEPKWR